MRMVIGGMSDTIGQAFKDKAAELTKHEGRPVTMARLFERLYESKYGEVFIDYDENRDDNDDDALSIFDKDDDLDIFAPDEEEDEDTESELMIDLCNHIGYMQSEMVNLKNAIDALRVEVKNMHIDHGKSPTAWHA